MHVVTDARRRALRAVVSVAAAALAAATGPAAEATEFRLKGGHFYGPGPIEPDAALPDGRLVNIRFDRHSFTGECGFVNDGTAAGVFSDGATRMNQNIDAGTIRLGDGRETVRLAAVDGGPHGGAEHYYLDADYNMIWRVDLALDPGFKEGIIRVDDFVLSTGVVEVQRSLQSQRRIPGGYDQAGSLKSGQFLAGRLGDFDQDGFMDGVLVAAPNVPMEANLLPGAPVGNKRAFTTDVELPAHLAAELTLRGVTNFRAPLAALAQRADPAEFRKLHVEIGERLRAARDNMERAIFVGAWKEGARRARGHDLTWRVDALQTLSFIVLAFTDAYYPPTATNRPGAGVQDATRKLFEQLAPLIEAVAELNRATGDTLPRPAGSTGARNGARP
jgi:hypothetical protein